MVLRWWAWSRGGLGVVYGGGGLYIVGWECRWGVEMESEKAWWEGEKWGCGGVG